MLSENERDERRIAIIRYGVPAPVADGLMRYFYHHIAPGTFVGQVLCNNLVGSFDSADDDNITSMHNIVRYVYSRCPIDRWGTLEKVKMWLTKKE